MKRTWSETGGEEPPAKRAKRVVALEEWVMQESKTGQFELYSRDQGARFEPTEEQSWTAEDTETGPFVRWKLRPSTKGLPEGDDVHLFVEGASYHVLGESVPMHERLRIVLTGRTEDGRTLGVSVYGMDAFLYWKVPQIWIDQDRVEQNVALTMARLAKQLRYECRPPSTGRHNARRARIHHAVKSLEYTAPVVRWDYIEDMVEMFGYHGVGATSAMVRISLIHPKLVPLCREMLLRPYGGVVGTSKVWDWGSRKRWDADSTPADLGIEGRTCDTKEAGFEVFEAKVPYVDNFMLQRGCQYTRWVRLPKHVLRPPRTRLTYCDLECHAHWEDVHLLEEQPPDPPQSILSIDAEMEPPDQAFPRAKNDRVLQIAAVHEPMEGGRSDMFVFCLGSLATPAADSLMQNVTVFSYDEEAQMLLEFWRFVVTLQPSFLTGWNVSSFDIPYLYNRSVQCGVGWAASTLGLLKNETLYWNSRKYKGREIYTISGMTGIVLCDMMLHEAELTRTNPKKLSLACSRLLDHDNKLDFSYELIAVQQQTPGGRLTMAAYCVQDARLPIMVGRKIKSFSKLMEFARIHHTPMHRFMTAGAEVKCRSGIRGWVRQHGHEVWHWVSSCDTWKIVLHSNEIDTSGQYTGGYVTDPQVGYYPKHLVVVLDFKSLYPSCMMAHNLGPSTWMLRRHAEALGWTEGKEYNGIPVQAERENGEPYMRAPRPEDPHYGIVIVSIEVFKGLYAQIEEFFFDYRHAIKAERARCHEELAELSSDDPRAKQLRKRIADLTVREQSVKLFMNSLYGILACFSPFCIKAIAYAITNYGQGHIKRTAWLAQRKFTDARHGFHPKLVYGDTDSIIVALVFRKMWRTCAETGLLRWCEPSVHKARSSAWMMSLWMEETLNEDFEQYTGTKRLCLEAENMITGMVLSSKKKYAGCFAEQRGPHKLTVKGMANKQRNTSRNIKDAMDAALVELCLFHDPESARKRVHRALLDVRNHRVSVMDVSASATLTKDLDDYTTKTLGVAGARAIRQRTKRAPVVGERFRVVKARPLHRTKKPEGVFESTIDDISLVASARAYDEEHYMERGILAVANIMNVLYDGQDIEERRRAFHQDVHRMPGLERSSQCVLPKFLTTCLDRHCSLQTRDHIIQNRRRAFLETAQHSDLFTDTEKRGFARELKKIKTGTLHAFFSSDGRTCEACLVTIVPETQRRLRAANYGYMLDSNRGAFCHQCLLDGSDASPAELYVTNLFRRLSEAEQTWADVLQAVRKVITEDEALSSLVQTQDLTPQIVLSVLPDSSALFWRTLDTRRTVVETRAVTKRLGASDLQDALTFYGLSKAPDVGNTSVDIVWEDDDDIGKETCF